MESSARQDRDSTASPPGDTRGADAKIESREELEERILRSEPRMKPTDRFRFACHPGVSCFGDCCGNVNIFLTPKDVLRLKNRLGLESGEFLEQRTILPGHDGRSLPAPLLRMNDDEKRSCPFLTSEGCSVYEDRPWACRMYPVGFATPREAESSEEPFYFLVREKQCHGFDEDREWTVSEWIRDQGLDQDDRSGELFREAGNDNLDRWKEEDPRKVQMFFMATYDLDTFRRFVFTTSLLERFDLDSDEVERMRTDDEALLEFGVRWIEFCLFGKRTMKLREQLAQESTK